MERDFAIEWVEALRSGKYKQGFGALRTIDTDGTLCHCAVGVLADIIDPNGWNSSGYDLAHDLPPTSWRGSQFGIGRHVPHEIGLDYFVIMDAMTINDDEEADFNAIADFLEDKLSSAEIAG